MFEDYEFIPENKGKIEEVAFVSSPNRQDVPLLKSFIKTLPTVKVYVFAPSQFSLEKDYNYTTLDELKDFTKKNSNNIKLIMFPADCKRDRSLFSWARNSLITLQKNNQSIIIPSLLSNYQEYEYSLNLKDKLDHIEQETLDLYKPISFIKEIPLLKYFNSADVLVTNDFLVIDYKVLIDFIMNNKDAQKIVPINDSSDFWKGSTKRKVNNNASSLKNLIRHELDSNLGDKQIIFVPAFGKHSAFYDLDTALMPYADRSFFVASKVDKKIKDNLKEQGLELTDYPCQLWNSFREPYIGVKLADINVLQENYSGEKIVYLPNRINVSEKFVIAQGVEPIVSKRYYKSSQIKAIQLWEEKGFDVKLIDYSLDNCTGLRCAFQVLKRSYS